ncbi:MAG: tetratricopeptide repeat protein [Gammaproteobacteria bacterium]
MQSWAKIVVLMAGLALVAGTYAGSRDTRYKKTTFWRIEGVSSKEKDLPKAVQALDRQAVELIAAKKYNLAIAALTESLKQHPANAAALANRAHCYRSIGEFEKAVADYREAKAADPKVAPLIDRMLGDMYLGRGRTRIDRGDLKGAADDLAKAAQASSTKAQALSELSYIALVTHDFDTCITMAARSQSADPVFTDPRINKGLCLLQSGRPREAIDSLSSAIRIAAYVTVGDCPAAKKDAAVAAAVDPASASIANRVISSCL